MLLQIICRNFTEIFLQPENSCSIIKKSKRQNRDCSGGLLVLSYSLPDRKQKREAEKGEAYESQMYGRI